MFDKGFDDFSIGETWNSHGRTITEADLVLFSGLTGDHYPLHTDSEYARGTMFKQRIAHGMLVLSYGVGLIRMEPDVIVANYGLDGLRFISPVYIGDTIKVELEVVGLQDKGNGTGLVTTKCRMFKSTGEDCLVYLSKALVKKN